MAIEMERSMNRTQPMVSEDGTLGPTPVTSPGTVNLAIMPGWIFSIVLPNESGSLFAVVEEWLGGNAAFDDIGDISVDA